MEREISAWRRVSTARQTLEILSRVSSSSSVTPPSETYALSRLICSASACVQPSVCAISFVSVLPATGMERL